MEICEEVRHSEGMRTLYDLRKQTIERNFGTAKEHHAIRYTQQLGKEKMTMKVALTFACMNMKKLARLLSLKTSHERERVTGTTHLLHCINCKTKDKTRKSGFVFGLRH